MPLCLFILTRDSCCCCCCCFCAYPLPHPSKRCIAQAMLTDCGPSTSIEDDDILPRQWCLNTRGSNWCRKGVGGGQEAASKGVSFGNQIDQINPQLKIPMPLFAAVLAAH